MNEAMSQMPMGETDKGGKGAMIGAVIVVLVLIVGGIYFFSGKRAAPTEPAMTPEEEASVIQSSLDTIDLGGVDAELKSLDEEVSGLK